MVLYHFSSPCSYMNLNFSIAADCSLSDTTISPDCLFALNAYHIYIEKHYFFYFLDLAFGNLWQHLFVARNIFMRCLEPDLYLVSILKVVLSRGACLGTPGEARQGPNAFISLKCWISMTSHLGNP